MLFVRRRGRKIVVVRVYKSLGEYSHCLCQSHHVLGCSLDILLSEKARGLFCFRAQA